jgi:hypothetical protein
MMSKLPLPETGTDLNAASEALANALWMVVETWWWMV